MRRIAAILLIATLSLAGLGGIYEKQGKTAEAKSSYAASLKINPNQKDVDAAIKRVS